MTLTWNSATLILAFLFATPVFAQPRITGLSFELEMKDFHDTAAFSGPIHEGVPVTITFRNKTILKLVPVAIQDKTIRFQTKLLRGSGGMLYNATFYTKYNSDADLSEKKPNGDLVYHLKLNPKTAEQ